MKTGGWLSIVAMMCLVISGAALAVHSLTVTTHSVIPTVTGDSVFVPAVTEVQLISNTTPPPPVSACFAIGIRCFTPQSMTAGYNFGPLYDSGFNGKGKTIAIIDSFGSPTIADDLHTFDVGFGLQPMCGETGVTCTPGMPTFSVLEVQGSPPPVPQPPNNGTGQENHFGWAVEVSLDVEWAHATAPGANIILVTTPTAETLGVQGFPQMMNAVQYVVDHHLADVISMSLSAGEGTFKNGTAALQNLRKALIAAQANGVTVLAATGDNGSANVLKQPVKNPPLIPYPPAVAVIAFFSRVLTIRTIYPSVAPTSAAPSERPARTPTCVAFRTLLIRRVGEPHRSSI
jgi:subtilase family serine protease